MRYAIIGAGVSGLTAAWQLLGRGVAVGQIEVFEATARTGGVLRRGELGGQVVDLGAESMLARRPEAIELAHQVGLGEELEQPAIARAAIWSRGCLHPMPTGHVMGVPAESASLAGLLSEPELQRLAQGLGQPAQPRSDDVSVAEFVGDRVGRAVVDRLVEPLLGGVYAGRVDELSLRATVPALASAATSGAPLGPTIAKLLSASTGAGPVFLGLRGGVARLTDALQQRLVEAGVRIHTDAVVTGLARHGSGWHLDGPRVSHAAETVIVALPAPAAARLLRQTAETEPVAAELGQVQVASMALLSIALPAEALGDHGRLSGVLVPAVEKRLVKAMTFTSRKWAWAAGERELLRLSVGRAGEAEALQLPDTELARAALADASSLLGVELHPSSEPIVTRWGGGLPQYNVGHLARLERARLALAGVPGLQACGASWGGVGIPACIAAARRAADLAMLGE